MVFDSTTIVTSGGEEIAGRDEGTVKSPQARSIWPESLTPTLSCAHCCRSSPCICSARENLPKPRLVCCNMLERNSRLDLFWTRRKVWPTFVISTARICSANKRLRTAGRHVFRECPTPSCPRHLYRLRFPATSAVFSASLPRSIFPPFQRKIDQNFHGRFVANASNRLRIRFDLSPQHVLLREIRKKSIFPYLRTRYRPCSSPRL